MIKILSRERILINTDPQRRCYNGCHAKSKLVWTPWKYLETTTEEKLDKRLEFWRSLSDYAVSQRGESAKSEFKTEIEEKETE